MSVWISNIWVVLFCTEILICLGIGLTTIATLFVLLGWVILAAITLVEPVTFAVNFPVVAFIIPTVVLSTLHVTFLLVVFFGLTNAVKYTLSPISKGKGIGKISM